MSRYVFEGPRWYRSRIRSRGPFLALVPPAVLGVLSLLLLNVFDGKTSGYGGLLLGVFAAPGLLAVGAPFSSDSVYPIGVTLSVMLWLDRRRHRRGPGDPQPDGHVGRLLAQLRLVGRGHLGGAIAALLIARLVVGDAGLSDLAPRRLVARSCRRRPGPSASAADRPDRHARCGRGPKRSLLTVVLAASPEGARTARSHRHQGCGWRRAWRGRCHGPLRGRRRRRTARSSCGGRRSPGPWPVRCPAARRARPPSPG